MKEFKVDFYSTLIEDSKSYTPAPWPEVPSPAYMWTTFSDVDKCNGSRCEIQDCSSCFPCTNKYCKTCYGKKEQTEAAATALKEMNLAFEGFHNYKFPKFPPIDKDKRRRIMPQKEFKTMDLLKKINKIRSAKAKSVYSLATPTKFQSSVKYPYSSVPHERLFLYPILDDKNQIETLFSAGPVEMFARPCPLNPVHGFVESRPIKTYNQFLSLVDEVNQRKVDDILEILLMPTIKAEYSAIVTPNSITIGEGNDGATAGNRSVVINTPNTIVEYIVDKKVVKQFTKKNEVPFVEVVHGNLGQGSSSSWVVQVRSGNQPEGFSSDFVPKDVVVQRVHEVTTQTDLLVWKTTVENFTDGDVIYASSMSCHGAVHGVANKIPVITSHLPKAGEQLKAGFVPPLDTQRVATLLKYLLRTKDSIDYNRVLYGWKFAHTLAVNNHAGGEEVVAYCLYNLVMGGLAACLGEYRHARGKKLKGFTKSRGRSAIFKDTFENKKRAFSTIHKVLLAFLSPRFSSGFGGQAWADCAQGTILLQRAIVDIIRNPTEAVVNKAIEAANNLAHAQHNGGILFNKFGNTTESVYDLVAQEEVVSKLLQLSKVEKSTISQILLKTMEKDSPVAVKELVEKMEKTKKKQAEIQKKLMEQAKKQQEQMKLQQEKNVKLKEELEKKYGHLSFIEKLMHPTTKFQIRLLEENMSVYRLQIKLLGQLIEMPVTLKEDNFKFPTPTKKSWAGTGAKYSSIIITEVDKLENEMYNMSFEFKNGTKIATNPVNINDKKW
jgi:hypothetical protein